MTDYNIKEHYRLWFNPQDGAFRAVIDTYSYIPIRNGWVETTALPFANREEKDLFKMLYPAVDTDVLEVNFKLWQMYDGPLQMTTYSPKSLDSAGSQA